MNDQILEYSPKIDKKIKRAVSESLNTNVGKTERIIHIRLAIKNIPYYLYAAKNNKAAETMNTRLKNLTRS